MALRIEFLESVRCIFPHFLIGVVQRLRLILQVWRILAGGGEAEFTPRSVWPIPIFLDALKKVE